MVEELTVRVGIAAAGVIPLILMLILDLALRVIFLVGHDLCQWLLIAMARRLLSFLMHGNSSYGNGFPAG